MSSHAVTHAHKAPAKADDKALAPAAMDVWDYYAAAALSGNINIVHAPTIAQRAAEIADALMAERASRHAAKDKPEESA